jgi:hypothetical protein
MPRHRRSYAGVRAPTVRAVEDALELHTREWRGRCHEIACRMLEVKLVVGQERYGHYYGSVVEGFFRAGLPFYRHGWIEAREGVVVDPTRWVFERCRPYIYVGPADEYDACGERLAASLLGPYPSVHLLGDAIERFDDQAYFDYWEGRTTRLGLSTDCQYHIAHLTNGQGDDFTNNQLFWLANAPPSWYGHHAREVYAALEAVDQKALIPIDNWRLVMGRPFAEHCA